LKISERIFDAERFSGLTDFLLKQIEISTEPSLEESRKIVKRIRQRKLYSFVDEIVLSDEHQHQIDKLTEADIADGKEIKEQDIILKRWTNNYAMGLEDPVSHIRFYNKWEPSHAFCLERDTISALLPSTFQERCLRLYCRNPDKVVAAQDRFRNLMREHAIRVTERFDKSPKKGLAPKQLFSSSPSLL